MKAPIYIALMACLFAACERDRGRVNYDPQTARAKIIATLPVGWSLAPIQDELQQRWTAAFFAGPGNEAFMLVGPQPNCIEWTDHEEKTHREFLAKECLYVWIVPGDFEQIERRTFFNFFFDPPVHRRAVCSCRNVRVYAQVEQYIADTNRFAQILKECSGVGSPEIHLSWKSWRRDFAASLTK
jgi:hypothetical protein